jgi:hypothetical protein
MVQSDGSPVSGFAIVFHHTFFPETQILPASIHGFVQ